MAAIQRLFPLHLKTYHLMLLLDYFVCVEWEECANRREKINRFEWKFFAQSSSMSPSPHNQFFFRTLKFCILFDLLWLWSLCCVSLPRKYMQTHIEFHPFEDYWFIEKWDRKHNNKADLMGFSLLSLEVESVINSQSTVQSRYLRASRY